MPRRTLSFASLVAGDVERLALTSCGLDFIVALLLLTLPLWWRADLVRLVVFGALLVLGWVCVNRYRLLRHLYASGVEVEATLAGVSDSFGETDFRSATYRFEFDGRIHEMTLTATDLFMPLVTRHGPRVLLLVDPDRPDRAVILRSL